MREYTCVVCGAKGIDESYAHNRKYCSRRCRDIYHTNERTKISENPCLHNENIMCNHHKCGSCGWNPAVAKKRLEAFV